QRSRSHLSAGHSIDRIIHKEDRNVLAAICRVQNLVAPDRGKVAVALIAYDDTVGERALYGGSSRGRSSVRHLNVAHVEVVVREDRAPNRVYQHGSILDAKIVDGFGNVLVKIAVAAAWAVMRCNVIASLAIKLPIDTVRSLICFHVHRLPRWL